MYTYYTKEGVKVTSSVKPHQPTRWDSVIWHTPLSWSLWARKIRKDSRKRGAR